MKTFSVYLDTETGRSQVTFEAEKVEVKEETFEFTVEGAMVAMFSREKAFGFVEERPRSESWEEGPPEFGT